MSKFLWDFAYLYADEPKTLELLTQTTRTALEDINKDAGLMRQQIEDLPEGKKMERHEKN